MQMFFNNKEYFQKSNIILQFKLQPIPIWAFYTHLRFRLLFTIINYGGRLLYYYNEDNFLFKF